MSYVVLITGASSGFGLLTARALAYTGHTVYASMRDVRTVNAELVTQLANEAINSSVSLRTVELDVTSQDSTDAAVAKILADEGRIDVVIHNAGHMGFGPAESFTTDQLASLYDVNVLSTQRLNRAVLPHMRMRGEGLIVWVSSSSAKGGVPPYLGPYFAAKAAMDQLAASYAGELARFGIETTIVVPGAFTTGTKHFESAAHPGDSALAAEYASGPNSDFESKILNGLASLEPDGADADQVANAIVAAVDRMPGARPYRVYVDPSRDGAEVVGAVADRVREELLRRIGLHDIVSTNHA